MIIIELIAPGHVCKASSSFSLNSYYYKCVYVYATCNYKFPHFARGWSTISWCQFDRLPKYTPTTTSLSKLNFKIDSILNYVVYENSANSRITYRIIIEIEKRGQFSNKELEGKGFCNCNGLWKQYTIQYKHPQ